MTSGIESSKFLALLRRADALVEAEEKLLELRFSLAMELLPLRLTEALLGHTPLCTSRLVTEYALPSTLHMEYARTTAMMDVRHREAMESSANPPTMMMLENAFAPPLLVLRVLQDEEDLQARRIRRKADYSPNRN